MALPPDSIRVGSTFSNEETHPLLPAELVGRIESSDPSLTSLEIRGELRWKDESRFLGERGSIALARCLSLNTCITSLNLANNKMESGGLAALLPALTHLTALTSLDLDGNSLNKEDAARICGAVAAAGMTRLQRLKLKYSSSYNGYLSVVGCEAWKQLGLSHAADDIVFINSFSDILQYLFSSDRAAFALSNRHPLLPAELVGRIESSDPSLTSLEIKGNRGLDESLFLGERGSIALARCLSLNTCITSLNLADNQIGSVGLAALLPALTHLTALTSLDLGDNSLNEEDVARIFGAAAGAGMTRLLRLELNGNNCASDTVSLTAGRDLSRCLALNTCITSLNLAGNAIGSVGLAALLPALTHLTALTSLNLGGNSLKEEDVARIFGAVAAAGMTRLQRLELRGNNCASDTVSLTAGRELSRCLALNTCITSLNLAGNAIGSVGLAALLPALPHLTALTSLDLGDNSLNKEDAARICGAVAAAGMTRLQRLELYEIDGWYDDFRPPSVVGCEAWKQLGLSHAADDIVIITSFSDILQYLFSSDRAAFALSNRHPLLPAELVGRIESSDPSLTSLEIKGNRGLDESLFLGERGSIALARCLSLNTCITSLNLANNQIGSVGLAALLPALTHLTALTSLDLSHQRDFDSSCAVLACSLSFNTCITSLNLAGNDMSSGGLSALLTALTHLTALTSLEISSRLLTVEDIARLCRAAAAAGMTRLQRLELNHCGSYTSVVGCEAWKQLGLSHAADDIVIITSFSDILQYLFSSDRAAFAVSNRHPLLPAELVGRIESSDPSLTILEIRGIHDPDAPIDRIGEERPPQHIRLNLLDSLGKRGSIALARCLSLNTCITSLNLAGNAIGSGGLAALLPALTHLTALTSLDLGGNSLKEEDVARIFGAAAAAGMTRLQRLELKRNVCSMSSVVGCEAWKQLGLPQPPDEIVKRGFDALIQYVLSSDKVASSTIRVFVIGESTVRHPLILLEYVHCCVYCLHIIAEYCGLYMIGYPTAIIYERIRHVLCCRWARPL
jgi:Ran GTPase-activating protein (RanGAP) involved in mRNA processing and transport/ubiquinone biosynthesis protein COQ9